jgi:hypothetical protein
MGAGPWSLEKTTMVLSRRPSSSTLSQTVPLPIPLTQNAIPGQLPNQFSPTTLPAIQNPDKPSMSGVLAHR